MPGNPLLTGMEAVQDPAPKGKALPHRLQAALALHLNFHQFFPLPPTPPSFTTAWKGIQIQTIPEICETAAEVSSLLA